MLLKEKRVFRNRSKYFTANNFLVYYISGENETRYFAKKKFTVGIKYMNTKFINENIVFQSTFWTLQILLLLWLKCGCLICTQWFVWIVFGEEDLRIFWLWVSVVPYISVFTSSSSILWHETYPCLLCTVVVKRLKYMARCPEITDCVVEVFYTCARVSFFLELQVSARPYFHHLFICLYWSIYT